MAPSRIRIATRKSPLAVWQAEYVADRLRAEYPGLEVELVKMSTRGDKILDAPLARIGGKGLFLKELEQGLLEGRADLAVHSMKDVPAEVTPKLHIPVIPPRADPRDAFLARDCHSVAELPHGARVGSASLRRQCQLRAARPDLVVETLRGSVNTRLQKLEDGAFDAIILAASGLQRLGLEGHVTRYLPPEESLPAVGQGALGIQCRVGDSAVERLVAPLDHAPSHTRVTAERALNRELEGSCQVPIAAYAELDGDALHLRALVGAPSGDPVIRGETRGGAGDAELLGTRLGRDLLERGAREVLAALHAGEAGPEA